MEEWNPLRQMPRFVVSIVKNGSDIRKKKVEKDEKTKRNYRDETVATLPAP